jgi:rhamnosyltransferase subunit B
MMPMSYDQPDNAIRAERLGVARWLSPGRFTTERVTAELTALLDRPEVLTDAAGCAERLRQMNGIELACDLLEGAAQ